jgi:chromosome condensin MukBEF ATPase and DNA-binding subunit MukB
MNQGFESQKISKNKMVWNCHQCDHANPKNFQECEVCGIERNLYAEEVFNQKNTIKSLKLELSNSKRISTILNKKVKKLEEEILSKDSLCKDLICQINSQKNNINNLTKEISTIIKTKNYSERDVERLKLLLKEKNEILSSSKNKYTSLELEINSLKEENKTLKWNLKKINSNYSEVRSWLVFVIILLLAFIILFSFIFRHKMLKML